MCACVCGVARKRTEDLVQRAADVFIRGRALRVLEHGDGAEAVGDLAQHIRHDRVQRLRPHA